MLARWQVKCS